MKDESVIREIEQLFEERGKFNYDGEEVTQFDHAAQCCLQAIKETDDPEIATAAFLHDIGHLVTIEEGSHLGNINHSKLGAEWLMIRGFSMKVIEIVAHHVDAKRYLCFSNPAYYNSLSQTSKRSLSLQGGKMTDLEAERFRQNPFFREIIMVRKWDDMAKVKNKEVPELHFFMDIIKDLATNRQ